MYLELSDGHTEVIAAPRGTESRKEDIRGVEKAMSNLK